MKQRMYNTFKKIIKIDILAKILSDVGYFILRTCYYIYRKNICGNSNLSIEDAHKILNMCSTKPHMNVNYCNKSISKELSIIVPTYNAEKTIAECIESVISQKTKIDYELIIVNDGSTDNTQSVIERYVDEHIKIISQENKGFSGARNRGIDESMGKYLMFLDSDDYLMGDCLEKMMNEIMNNNADIVQGSYLSFNEKSNIKWISKLKKEVMENNPEKLVSNPGYPWAKIYKRDLFDKVRFPLNVWFEDTIVCMILYRLSHKIVIMDDIVYAWRINPEGVTQKARHSTKCVDHYWVMEYILEKSTELGLPNDELQYEMVKSHMSTFLYRRLSLMDEEVIESAFILAGNMLNDIRPKEYFCKGNFIQKDIEKAFVTNNYKLWKAASFVV